MQEPDNGEPLDDLEIALFLEGLYRRYHYDFRSYSMASLKRRIKQARERFKCKSISGLQELALHDPSIFPQLLSYLTVQVSEFFRDPSYFRALREVVIPHLKTYPFIKIWVAGCSTGEEVYSFAIMLREEGFEGRAMIYGTDINTESLRKAEAGIYSIERVAQFTENHRRSGGKSSLSNYYTAAYDGVVFDPTLRRGVVFSDHSLVTDSVFAETHLISCRNVLIYFNRALQDRAVTLFRDSLVRKGFLGLGSKESLRASARADDFIDFVKDEKIYQRR